ncbi:MAG: PIG-L deacetylase family protein [Bacteroidota bacterium]
MTTTTHFFLALCLLTYSCCALLGQPIIRPLVNPLEVAEEDRLENQQDKSILVFTPHPDDETFSSAGTLAKLAQKGNNIHIVIYTNDNKGSKDLDMTRERLARIRRLEEEKACDFLGIPKTNIHWLGYEDGDLEYADPQVLRGRVARLIKIYKPDIVLSPDPGTEYVQWHKTDHRMAANITQDAFIAAEWHLYYPQHYLDEGLEAFGVKEVYYYYSQAPNYEVVITDVFEQKAKACAAHVSQFEPSVSKYTPDMSDELFQAIRDRFRARSLQEDGRIVERFRKVGE